MPPDPSGALDLLPSLPDIKTVTLRLFNIYDYTSY